MIGNDMTFPDDFRPVDGCVPDWIDIKDICTDASRFVGLYSLTNLNAVAINNGKAVFTTSDQNGEFRAIFDKVIRLVYRDADIVEDAPTLVYDCEERRQWLAPRPSAMRFLYSQVRDN